MKIIVIGSNAAGMSFAAKYKRNNPTHEIIAFEKRDYVSFGSCGLPYFVGEFFEDKNEMIARTVEDTIASGIDLRINTEVTEIDFDSKKVLANNEWFEYDKLIISTGARPIVPNFGEFNLNNFSTLTSFEDGLKVKETLSSKFINNVTIIGGGFIGLELIEACLNLNKNITLVEANNTVLGNQFEKEITEIAHQRILDSNVDLKLNTQVMSIEDTSTGYKINTSNGDFETDYIICSVGFKPNTEFINLDKLNNGAIIVNEYCETNIKDVYAIGDCATSINYLTKKPVFTPLATVANKYGRMLGDHLSGIETNLNGMLGSSCLKLIDLDLARVGLTKTELENSNFDFDYKIVNDKNHTSYYPGQSDVRFIIFYEKLTYKILGAQMIGQKEIVGRINTIAAAITMGMTTKQLGYLDLCYAPPFARTWDILNVSGNIIKQF